MLELRQIGSKACGVLLQILRLYPTNNSFTRLFYHHGHVSSQQVLPKFNSCRRSAFPVLYMPSQAISLCVSPHVFVTNRQGSFTHFYPHRSRPSFSVDLGALETRYKDLQKQLHPDKFSTASEVGFVCFPLTVLPIHVTHPCELIHPSRVEL
jgi:hypothetical protein